MSHRLGPPPNASVAHQLDGDRMNAPAAARNAGAIADLLLQEAPSRGRALELASGTGQHVAALAARLPGLHWQPTDIDAARLRSIDAHVAAAGLTNVAPAANLDATAPGWSAQWGGQSLVLLVNLLHLISAPETRVVIAEAAAALAPGGRFVIYGPFMRGGELTSEGDRNFNASLIAHDPAIGYKDDFDTLDLLVEAGLEIVAIIEMPANNLALIAEKAGT